MKKKLKKLSKVLEIANLNSSDEIKSMLICKIYVSSYEFVKDYIDVYKYYENDSSFLEISSKLDGVYDIFVSYEELGLINNAIKNEKYRENLDFYRMIINDYIEYTSRYSEKEFLDMLGISDEVFGCVVKAIRKMDRKLYDYYIYMRDYNKRIYCNNNILIIKDLANGIKTGFFEDGTEFSLLEFIIRVPFKLEGGFCISIEKFMKDNNMDEYNIISRYIHYNKLNGRNVFRPLEVWELYCGDIYVGGHKMTFEDNDIILKYMIQNDLPFIRKVYNIIRSKYLAGEITSNDILNDEEVNSCKKILRKKYSSYLGDGGNISRK